MSITGTHVLFLFANARLWDPHAVSSSSSFSPFPTREQRGRTEEEKKKKERFLSIFSRAGKPKRGRSEEEEEEEEGSYCLSVLKWRASWVLKIFFGWLANKRERRGLVTLSLWATAPLQFLLLWQVSAAKNISWHPVACLWNKGGREKNARI